MNKEQSAWVEINKSIAEKQTIYVGQKAAINAYKISLENLKYEKELIKKEMATVELQNKLLSDNISELAERKNRLLNHIDLLQKSTESCSNEIKEVEQSMKTLKEEHLTIVKNETENIVQMEEDLLALQPEYPKYRALKDHNLQLQADIAQLQADYTALENEVIKTEESKTMERNKQVLELVMRTVQLQKLQALKKEHDESCIEYKRATEELMNTLLTEDQSITTSTVEEDEVMAYSVNTDTINTGDFAAELNETITNQNNVCNKTIVNHTEEKFKIPIVPPPTAPKVTVLQNLDVSMSAGNKYMLENKRKSDTLPISSSFAKKSKSMVREPIKPASTTDFDGDAYTFQNSGELQSDFFLSDNFAFGQFGDNETNSESDKDDTTEHGFLDFATSKQEKMDFFDF
ncbi:uncharacterized protein [Atheta coriaria]|uniref:uncharacterized protein isoform X2 n=1 Tax=Dalotia coriaria TaxID=877792 RepID=UPI0031F4113E